MFSNSDISDQHIVGPSANSEQTFLELEDGAHKSANQGQGRRRGRPGGTYGKSALTFEATAISACRLALFTALDTRESRPLVREHRPCLVEQYWRAMPEIDQRIATGPILPGAASLG